MSDGFKSNIFKHHRPISGDDIDTRILTGLDGAFRERARDEGYDVREPCVGVVVQFNSEGQIEGSRLVKCGIVKAKELNTTDVWPDAEEGRLVIQEFDLEDFGDINGSLTTRYVEIPYKVLVRKGESWKSVKKSERENKGYSNLVFRTHILPLSAQKVKFLTVAVPGEIKTLVSTYGQESGSRGFPGIRIHEGRAKIVSPEEVEHRWGLGVQPFYLITDGVLDSQGEVDTSLVRFPGSMDIKLSVTSLLQSAGVPNWHWKQGNWDEVVKSQKYNKRQPDDSWPAPRQENEDETEASEESEVEGEQCCNACKVAIFIQNI